jgi:uncharacterized membrane protein
MLAGVVGIGAGTVTAFFTPWQVSTLIGWDVAAALYVAWVWTSAGRFDPEETQTFATREDDSRFSAQLLLVSACLVSLLGVGFDLIKAGQTRTSTGHVVLVSVAVATVVLSWAVVHTVYALRYAHEYYAYKPVGGIDFKSGSGYMPDYRDFAYVAFVVGMTFQVSDTDINHRGLRRSVLGHALLAYLFGAVILAVTINIVAQIFQ